MKLLFDQNLSPWLPRLLADLYPDSVHIRELGMSESTDTQIWEYASVNGFTIVSKDSDFQARSCCTDILQSSFGSALGTVR